MIRRFFRDSAVYVIPGVLTAGVSLFTFPLYAHHFSPKEYGLIDLLSLAGMIVGWTVALEIYQAVGRLLADERDPVETKAYASTALWFSAGAYLTFAIVAEAFSEPLSHVLLGSDVRLTLFRVAVVSMAVNGFLMIPQAQLRWQLRPVAFAVAAGINVVLTVVGSLVLVFGAGLGVEGMILGSIIGSTAGLVYVLISELDALLICGLVTFRPTCADRVRAGPEIYEARGPHGRGLWCALPMLQRACFPIQIAEPGEHEGHQLLDLRGGQSTRRQPTGLRADRIALVLGY